MNKMYLLSIIPLTVVALAEGGVFEPDNVIRVDTITVVEHHTIPLRVDTVTVYSNRSNDCITFNGDDGEQIDVSYVDISNDGTADYIEASSYTGRTFVMKGYRTCTGEIIRLGNDRKNLIRGTLF